MKVTRDTRHGADMRKTPGTVGGGGHRAGPRETCTLLAEPAMPAVPVRRAGCPGLGTVLSGLGSVPGLSGPGAVPVLSAEWPSRDYL